jgi:anaerobic magnesium-protoporphyrin IX monomethyl ester cyclase
LRFWEPDNDVATVTLIYPYFQPSGDNSIFRFPPLGLGYIAAYVKSHGISAELVDCTFMKQDEALEKVRRTKPRIIGIQAMFSMKEKVLELAQLLRKDCELLVIGGPLATSNPEEFIPFFDVVAIGEGEQTMLELVQAVEDHSSFSDVKGIVFKEDGKVVTTPPREFVKNLDQIPFPSRELFDNEAYEKYYSRNFGYTTTAIITSRGCPFQCDFCSRPIFGNTFRSRTPENIAQEVVEVRELGYERVWFADDCFTLSRERLVDICEELIRRNVKIGWECLSRVDTVDSNVAEKMKQAGCVRVFFGIESGNDTILEIMKKQITVREAREAVDIFKKTGIQVGAFFILGYPGENDETILDTVNFASSLPLDYLSFTFPYPIPGTPLFDRVKDRMVSEEWKEPKNFSLIKHKLLFHSSFSETKLRFALFKGMSQFYLRKYLGNNVFEVVGKPYRRITDALFRKLR